MATERALRNLDEAVGAMTEEHKLECQRRERAVRERVVDEWKVLFAAGFSRFPLHS